MKVKSALLAIVAIGALALSGCSTSDDSGDSGGDSTSGGVAAQMSTPATCGSMWSPTATRVTRSGTS